MVAPMQAPFRRSSGGGKGKWIVLGAWAVLVAVFGPFGVKLPDVTNDEIVLPSASDTARLDRVLSERFPGGNQESILLVYHRAGGLRAVDRTAIAADARAARGAALVEAVVPPFGPTGNPAFVSHKGDVAFTAVVLDANGTLRIRKTVDELRRLPAERNGLTLDVTGTPAFLDDLNTAIKGADGKLLAATGAFVLLLLMWIYRSPLLALIQLFVVGLAYAVTTGVIYLLARAGLPVDSTSTSLLLVLMFGAGTDYCLLLVASYRSELRRGADPAGAALRAAQQAGRPMIASGFTVIAALIAMLAGTLGLNRTLGPVNAIGIAIVLLAGLTLLPALLAVAGPAAFWPGKVDAGQGDARQRIWQALGTRVRRRPLPWLAGIILVLGGFAAGTAVYKSHADWFLQFRHTSDATRGFATLKQGFPAGELAPTDAVVDDLDGPLQASTIETVRARLAHAPGVAAVTGVQRRSTDGRAAELSVVFAGDPYSDKTLGQLRALRHTVSSPEPGVRVLLGEGTARQVDYKAAASRDTKVIAPIVLAIVLLTLIVLLRALVAPLFLLATVILSYAATMGISLLVFRYVFGQHSVEVTFGLIAFIFLVALGSDYNIFLMSRTREETRRLGTGDGMMSALVETGPVITSAGVILAGTFCVLTVLPIWELLELGVTVAVGVLIDTLLVRTVLVPAITWKAGERSWWPSSGAAAAPVTGTYRIVRPEES